MEITQVLNLLKNKKSDLDDQSNALGIAIGILENTLELKTTELKESLIAESKQKLVEEIAIEK